MSAASFTASEFRGTVANAIGFALICASAASVASRTRFHIDGFANQAYHGIE